MSGSQRIEGLLGTLPETLPAGGPEWLRGLRQEAAEHLQRRGFPTHKDEAWRFTSIKPIVSTPFVANVPSEARSSVEWAEAQLGEDATWRIVLTNGRPQLEAGASVPEGLELLDMAQTLEDAPTWVGEHLGRYAAREHFAALNAAMFRDGLIVHVKPGAKVEQPLHVVHVCATAHEPTASYPRVLVVAEEGSELKLVESFLRSGERSALTNAVTEVSVGQNAGVDHLRVTYGRPESYQVANLAVHQARDSRYVSRVVALGGALTRLDLDVALDGEGAECTLDGVYMVDDAEHVDHHTFIDHLTPHATSHETYRGIVGGKGHAVFDGTIQVARDAQHTSAEQTNRNLLLSDDAVVNTKPHLQIDADDVTCSHGAVVGALDDKQLFYLRSRGIDEATARAVLTYAFAREILDRIPEERLRDRLRYAVLDRLPGGESIRELA